LSAANKENARPAIRIAAGAKILSERMKVSFFENEFEEHSKGGENYQESPESERGTACLPACAQPTHVSHRRPRVDLPGSGS
jgi:hypothetical protein